jgi:hypothetical protein
MPDISKIHVNIEIQRLDKDLFAVPAHDPSWLRDRYGEFFDIYTEGVLGVGNSENPDFIANLNSFKNNEAVKIAENNVSKAFTDLDDLNRRLTSAFKYYKYHFPEKNIPALYSCISGFNQSVILTDSAIGISLEKYLGSDCSLYPMLGIAKYLSYNMKRDKITSDCLIAWAIGDWPYSNKDNNLASRIIYEGKLLYLAKQILCDEPDSLIFGFTDNQMKWCKNNETEMWRHLVQEQLLFSREPLIIRKLAEDAPYTSIFTQESPGKACNWIGYRIVCSYMDKSKDKSLKDLMENDNYMEILSKYKPS